MNNLNTFSKYLTYSMLLIAVLPLSAQAQDLQGNYYNNEGYVRSVHSQSAAGSLWRVVVSDGLNCRRSASLGSSIIRTYSFDAILEVELYRGGSDEVLINALDENGKPWMPVRGKDFNSVCYVRANNRYIQPFMR
jgi:hypothetical protein